jgi:valyl-tRNA synthetase
MTASESDIDASEETDSDAADGRPTPTLAGGYDPESVEPRWQRRWVDEGTYAYDPGETVDPDTVYAIDTPPPTVSGSLHMGHLYGHTLQDFAARFHRMAGEHTHFPFGYDDNGIASELLTEAELDIRHQDYSRPEFKSKVREVCRDYEADFTSEMQALATSIDWSRTYKTIEPRVQRLSQLSFLDLYERGREYRKRAPTIWCPDCETAISQVEMEDEERDSHFNDVTFDLVPDEGDDADGVDGAADAARADGTFTISTTRPELLPACVAVFVHPDDEDNADLVGREARVPLFGQTVPIIEDERVDLETGSGVVMCCTFGDQTDIEWYQAHDLPLRIAIDESATMTDVAGPYEGLSTDEAREAIVEDLDADGHLVDRRPHRQVVQVHERNCDRPVEFLVTEQWYVRLLDRKEEYLAAGREMEWYPEKMFTRYKHWIEGLEWDWSISRQRDSGIPIPVWYCGDCNEPTFAEREALPVDPTVDDPPVGACPACGHDELVPEDDVFDTWATSSLTPLINAGWEWDADAGEFAFDHPELYPATMRPQGHDIISFWLFHTVVKCLEHTGEVPFDEVVINGHVLDENRQKMSSSKGNVVLPSEVTSEYPVDAIRYWAASASVGDDFPFKENELTMGERLLQKVWNASKLVDGLTPAAVPDVDAADLAPIDRWLLAKLDDLVETVTAQFDDYEFMKARDGVRTLFWNTFCDNYLEVAKGRLRDADPASDPDAASAAYALTTAHRTFLKLFAPLLPHVTEEVWAATGNEGSIHRTDWPTPAGYDADLATGERAMGVISGLRKFKSDAQLPLNEPLAAVEVYGDVSGFESAIRDVMHVDELTVRPEADAPEMTVRVTDVALDYATLGPKYGERIGEFDAAIEAGEFDVGDDGSLHLAGAELPADTFDLERERTYGGDGEMVETDAAVLIVHRDGDDA